MTYTKAPSLSRLNNARANTLCISQGRGRAKPHGRGCIVSNTAKKADTRIAHAPTAPLPVFSIHPTRAREACRSLAGESTSEGRVPGRHAILVCAIKSTSPSRHSPGGCTTGVYSVKSRSRQLMRCLTHLARFKFVDHASIMVVSSVSSISD